MKVLFATNFSYLPQRSGGSESSTNDLCMALMARGIEVGVLCTLGMFDKIWFVNRLKSKISGEKFIKDKILSYPVFRGHDIKNYLYEVVEKFQPDVVVVQAGSPFELVNSFSRLGIPVVLYARDIEFQRNNESIEINRYVGFIANSQFTAQRLTSFLGVNPLVLPPLINPELYRVKSTRKVALHIGLVQEKGIEISFALAARRPDIFFQFVESWPIAKVEFTEFERRAKALGNVKISRRTADMRNFYGLANILLVPSICEEAWGRVVTEAQLSGIPVITSNRGGLPESVGNGGIIVPHDATIDEWERAFSELWDIPDNYSKLSVAAMERSECKDVSKDAIIEKFITHLQSHMALRPGSSSFRVGFVFKNKMQ